MTQDSGLWPSWGSDSKYHRYLSPIGSDLTGLVSNTYTVSSFGTEYESWIAVDSSSCVYIGSKQMVTKLDASDWSKKWVYDIHSGSSYYSPDISVGNDGVYVAIGKTFEKLNHDSGTVIWSYTSSVGDLTAPVITSGTIFIGDYSPPGHIHCIDSNTGIARWIYTSPDGNANGYYLPPNITFSGNIILTQPYIGRGLCRCIGCNSGENIWSYSGPYIFYRCAIDNSGDVILSDGGSSVIKLNPSDGSVDWISDISGLTNAIDLASVGNDNSVWVVEYDTGKFINITSSGTTRVWTEHDYLDEAYCAMSDQSGNLIVCNSDMDLAVYNISGVRTLLVATTLGTDGNFASISGGHILYYGENKKLMRFESNPVPNPPSPITYYPYIVTLLDSYEQFPLNSGNIVVGSQSLYGDTSGITAISGLSSGATTFTVSVPRCQTISISKDVDDSTTGTTTIYINRTGADKGM